jgi:hypothetical protein
MKEEGLVPDAITYSAAINAAATHGSQWQQALSLLREMTRARPRLQPHRPAYNAMLKVSDLLLHHASAASYIDAVCWCECIAVSALLVHAFFE